MLTKEQFEEFAELFFNPVSIELSIKFLIDLVKDKEFKFLADQFPLFPFDGAYNLTTSFYRDWEVGNCLLFANRHFKDRKLEVKHNNGELITYYSEEFSNFVENKYNEYKKAKERES